jgi:LCP family protein required for cell wall assembly
MLRKFLNKKTILIGSIALVTILLAVGGFALASTLDRIKNDPLSLFDPNAIITDAPSGAMTDAPKPTGPQASPTVEPTLAPGTTPTPNPYDELLKQADKTVLSGTVNVLLIGVDYEELRVTDPAFIKSKPYFNSDVMILLAMHFNSQGNLDKCDMISFPRDTYAPIHGMEGIYKMNFALAAGGGMNDNGYMNVCKTVEDQLGGDIPVKYYIQVDFDAVKDLVNAIGGVDYNVDIDFAIGTTNGKPREYKKGQQHMDGQGVLDYMRVRKNMGTGYIRPSSQGGDLNRVNRQKKMMLAVFDKLKNNTQLADVPRIMMNVKGVHTNIPFSLLALFAYHSRDIDMANVTMNTLPVSSGGGVFNKSYVLVNQTKRVDLIKKIFNKTVAPMYKYDIGYAKLQWFYMEGEVWTDVISHELIKDAERVSKETGLPDPLIVDPDLAELKQAIADTNKMMAKYKSRLDQSKAVISSSEYTELQNQVNALQSKAKTIFAKVGIKNVSWGVYVPMVMYMKE